MTCKSIYCFNHPTMGVNYDNCLKQTLLRDKSYIIQTSVNEKCTISWGFKKTNHKIVRFAWQCKRYKFSFFGWFF